MILFSNNRYRVLATLMVTLPLVVLLVAYIAICTYTGEIGLWNKVVHEAGQLTLANTVFYYEHASRELPLDIFLGLAVGSGVLFAYPPVVGDSKALGKAYRNITILSVVALILISTILVGTYLQGGTEQLYSNLLQMHTRPVNNLIWGAHWRYHFLSRISMMAISFGVGGVLVLITQRSVRPGNKIGVQIFIMTLLMFALVTGIFSLNADPFFNAVFLGHQIREVFTHGLVTLPIAWGTCLLFVGNRVFGEDASRTAKPLWPLIAGIAGVVIIAYLFVAALITSAVTQGQSQNIAVLLFPHFFEHTFSYLIVPVVASLVYWIVVLQKASDLNR